MNRIQGKVNVGTAKTAHIDERKDQRELTGERSKRARTLMRRNPYQHVT